MMYITRILGENVQTTIQDCDDFKIIVTGLSDSYRKKFVQADIHDDFH